MLIITAPTTGHADSTLPMGVLFTCDFLNNKINNTTT